MCGVLNQAFRRWVELGGTSSRPNHRRPALPTPEASEDCNTCADPEMEAAAGLSKPAASETLAGNCAAAAEPAAASDGVATGLSPPPSPAALPPPRKRLRPSLPATAGRSISGFWKQAKRDSGGRFLSKADVAVSLAGRVKAAARLEPLSTLVSSVPVGKAAAGAAHRLQRRKPELQRDILAREEQIRILGQALATGVFNRVIQPSPGMFDEDDLYERITKLQDGTFERRPAPPVDLTLAQRMKLAAQCHWVSEFLRALNARDLRYIGELEEHAQLTKRGKGRESVPGMQDVTSIAQEVVSRASALGAGDAPCAATLLNW